MEKWMMGFFLVVLDALSHTNCVLPESTGIWYAGTIVKIYDEEIVDAEIADGQIFEKVSPSQLRRTSVNDDFEVGSKVLARYDEGDTFFPGTIAIDHSDGTYDV